MFHNASEVHFVLDIGGMENTGLQVLSFDGKEAINKPYHFEINLINKNVRFDITTLLNRQAFLAFTPDKKKGIHGVIESVRRGPVGGEYAEYRIILTPRFKHLEKRYNQRIFQHKTVPQIISQILSEYGILEGTQHEFRLGPVKYPEREYCVQYDETDACFIQRLCEEEGIHYHFEHSLSDHKMVFGDSQPIFPSLEEAIRYVAHNGFVADKPVIKAFDVNLTSKTKRATWRDYNFKNTKIPEGQVEGKQSIKANGAVEPDIEFYDYPGRFDNGNRAKYLANIAVERLRKDQVLAEGYSDVPDLHSGYFFSIDDHPSLDATDPWLVNNIRHQGKQPQVLEAYGSGQTAKLKNIVDDDFEFIFIDDFEQGYRNIFTATPRDVVWRPALDHQKPKVLGGQTAKVVGPEGEEIYCDEYGRVKVQFHWDREGDYNENSSCWVRVASSWAHNGYGAVTIPRIGMEVVITFLEGDPDQPLITGCIHNGTNKLPYDLPANKTKSVFKTNSSKGGLGSNELRIEDKKFQEEIYIHAQRDMNLEVLHNQTNNVGNDRIQFIQGSDHLRVTNERRVQVLNDLSVSTSSNMHMKADNSYLLLANNEIHLQAGNKVVIDAGSELTLQAAGHFIKIDASGVSSSPLIHFGVGVPGVGTPWTGKFPNPLIRQGQKYSPNTDIPLPKIPVTQPILNEGEGVSNSMHPHSLLIGSPVNPILGCKVLPEEIDFKLAAPMPFVFSRSYNSRDIRVGSLGQGWSIPAEGIELEINEEQTIVIDSVGRRIQFSGLMPGQAIFSGSEQFWIRRGGYSELAIAWDDSWEVIPSELQQDANSYFIFYDTEVFLFQKVINKWRLQTIFDRNGHTTEFYWSNQGLINTVKDSADRLYVFLNTKYPTLHQGDSGYRLDAVGLIDSLDLQGTQINNLSLESPQVEWLVKYEFYENGDLKLIKDSKDNIVRMFTWENHIMVSHSKPNGQTVRYVWDEYTALGKVIEQTENKGLTRYYRYCDDHTEVRDNFNRVERYHFSGKEGAIRWTKHERFDGTCIEYEYDNYGRLVATTDSLGRKQVNRVDDYGHVTQVIQPDGGEWHYQFDVVTGKPSKVRAPEGQTIEMAYDNKGNLVTYTEATGAIISYQYNNPDIPHLPSEIIDASGGISKLEWNQLGQLASFTDSAGKVTKKQYDSIGRLISETNAKQETTKFEYDTSGHLIKVQLPDTTEINYQYNNLGKCDAIISVDQSVTQFVYDHFGNVVKVIDPAKLEINYTYNEKGQLVSVINQNNAKASFEYDELGRIVQTNNFDGSAKYYQYNDADELIESKDSSGRVVNYSYDVMGRLVERKLSATESCGEINEIFVWRKDGLLAQAINPFVKLNFTYDKAGRLIQEDQTHLEDSWYYQVDQSYDVLNNPQTTIYNNAPSIDWNYCGNGHLQRLQVAQIEMLFERDNLYREVSRNVSFSGTNSPLFKVQTTYNELGQLAKWAMSGNNHDWQRQYQYNQLGYIKQIKDNLLPDVLYSYDNSGRLIESKHDLEKYQYHFDPAGNWCIPNQQEELVEKRVHQSSTLYDLNIGNRDFDDLININYHPNIQKNKLATKAKWFNSQITEFNDNRYQYDELGNLTHITRKDGSQIQLQYDALNRVARFIKLNNGHMELYADYYYDPFSRRIRKVVKANNVTNVVRYGWHGDNLCTEAKDNKERTIVYQPNTFIPMLRIEHKAISVPIELRRSRRQIEQANIELPKELQFTHEDLRIAFYHTDHLGTPLRLTNEFGEVLWSAKPNDWKAITDLDSKVEQPIRFQGQLEDEESGFYYNYHRYYLPELGRYNSQNPTNWSNISNLYQYPHNPINEVNPIGVGDALCVNVKNHHLVINHSGLDLINTTLTVSAEHVTSKNLKTIKSENYIYFEEKLKALRFRHKKKKQTIKHYKRNVSTCWQKHVNSN
ncbi:type VI secretion system tip protein VgrG [Entomomonas sp. E2T0]|uniref:type VI secretion system tip protein TssI/VgrG n=1 Tax=Entomomonas sp. E2T0 TaxID=2930213 RepID=UPI002228121A|nr:type VI secretion system tip protein TssI/VgrG [Entomomonas sp. E2T0]UYZ83398.1 type VI secretion system tip protein VgrG [Entomomonas sp. E2T0]